MQLTRNPHGVDGKCFDGAPGFWCDCGEVWDAAVRATLGDVARDLDERVGRLQAMEAPAARSEAHALRKGAERYREAAGGR